MATLDEKPFFIGGYWFFAYPVRVNQTDVPSCAQSLRSADSSPIVSETIAVVSGLP
jgi:hypothetical protein